MLRKLLVVGLLLSLLGCIGTGNERQVAGRAMLTLGAHQFFLDTGNNGRTPIASREPEQEGWYADCRLHHNEFSISMYSEPARQKKNLWGVRIAFPFKKTPDRTAKVTVFLAADTLNGECEVDYKTLHPPYPYDVEVSTTACTVRTARDDDGGYYEARFDAFFRGESCLIKNSDMPEE